MNERWLSLNEICSHLGVSKETIYRWVRQKRIPAHKVGRLWKFRSSEVDQCVLKGNLSAFRNSKETEEEHNV